MFVSAKKLTALKQAVSGRLPKPVLCLNQFEAMEVKHEIITYRIHRFCNNFAWLLSG
jgi:hypothetical protein